MRSLGAFLRMVSHGVGNRLASDDRILVRGKGRASIRVSKRMVRKWFDVSIFRVLPHMCCNQIVSIPAVARLVKVDWDATSVEWSPFDYD